MKPWPHLLLLGLALLAPSLSYAQKPVESDKAEATLKTVPGLETRLWASEPLFVNPTCMDVDHKGRVWVCESVNYRDKLHGKPKLTRPEGDRIVILEDTKGKGQADKATTFYQSPELLSPLGIAVAKDPAGPGYKVFVCQSPDLLVFEDKDGDGKADGPPKKLLTGFRGYDHDHGIHGVLIGPDRKLYFSVGDQGVKDLQGADKKGPKWSSNSTDCRAGTIWRCELDGSQLEFLAHNFRNQYEPCVDSFGTVFVSDNDDDGHFQTRVCYVMAGGNYGYHPQGRNPSHWHEEWPGVVPKILRTYFGSPTGMCVYEGELLPKKYHGHPLHTDAGPRHLRCYRLTPDGAGYAVEREDMVTSGDDWFRPSDVCVAPDGAVFVADWYDPGVGGHRMRDLTRGRIYRVAPKGNKPFAPKVDLESTEGIVKALRSPNLAVRHMAMAHLAALKPADAVKVLEPAATQTDDPVLRARALWQLARVVGPKGRSKALDRLMNDDDPRFQILAIRIAKDHLGYSTKMLADYVAGLDKHKKAPAAVLREGLLALRDGDPKEVKSTIYQLMKRYDGKDRFYLCAAGIAVGHHDKGRREALLADFAKEFPGWDDRVAGLVWELRPPGAAAFLEKWLNDAKLSAAERARVADLLADAEDKGAGAVVLKLMVGDAPAAVRARALEGLKSHLPGKWQHLKKDAAFAKVVEGLLAKAESRAEGLALVGAAGKTDAVADVAKVAKDKAEALPVRQAAVEALGQLNTDDSVAALAALLGAEPASLRADAARALGELGRQKSPGALKALRALVRDDKRDLPLRVAAVGALASSQPGARWLLEQHAKKELPEALKGETGRLLRASVYRDVQKKAEAAFPPPAKLDLKKLPSIPALAVRKGDAARGKKLMAESVKSNLQCLKCHAVRGVGGQVGPDLSAIGTKASRENLYESILLPSKAVADQYLTWLVTTKKGVPLTGLIVEETPEHVVLRDGEGRDTKVLKKNVETREKGPKSMMPDDLLAYMTERDLIDVVEYMTTLKTPALSLDYWHVVGPFDGAGGLDKAFAPEKGIDLSATYAGKKGKVAWRTVKPGAGGYVDLQALFSPHGDGIVSYLARDVESPEEQEATVLLGTDEGVKLWVNGALVHTSRARRPAAPEEDAVKVKLKKGANTVLLKVVNTEGAHGFYFALLAGKELKPAAKK